MRWHAGAVRRAFACAALALFLASCGGDDGDSPANRVTDPIDKAKQTATSVEDRDQQLEDRADDGY